MKLFIIILMWWSANGDESVRECATVTLVSENFNSAIVLAQAAYVMQGDGNTDHLVHVAGSALPIPADEHGEPETPRILEYKQFTPCGEETEGYDDE
jgi:hypothetical protein